MNGKTWRLLRSWYKDAVCRVKIDGCLSKQFVVERGVKQGSILSPTLFLIVMNPLLKQLESSKLGLSINDYYAGGFVHADDIRTLSSSVESMRAQVEIVKKFANKRHSKLNVDKCEVVEFIRNQSQVGCDVEVEGVKLSSNSEGKCLGFWWRRDLLATRAIEEGIKKARKAFFYYGSIGAFQGDLSPLSTKSVIETCVLPVVLYGAENWIMTHTLIEKLNRFVGELAKRALRWPKSHLNTAALVTLNMESAESRVLVTKLGFLRKKFQSDGVGVGAAVMGALMDDVESMCLVKECREMEEVFGIDVVKDVLSDSKMIGMKEIKATVKRVDWERLIRRCKEKAPLIASVGDEKGWAKLWDKALQLGHRHTRGLQNLTRLLSHHGRGEKPCPLCETLGTTTQGGVLNHVLRDHSTAVGLKMDVAELLTHLKAADINFVYAFWKLY